MTRLTEKLTKLKEEMGKLAVYEKQMLASPDQHKPIAVRAIEACSERLDASIGIPQDALAPILQILIAERFKFVVLRGSKFRYRSARLASFSIQTQLGQDDLPEGTEDSRAF